MNLHKINNILSLFLELNENEQKAILNLLTPTSKPKDAPSPRVEDILEGIKRASEKPKTPYPNSIPGWPNRHDPLSTVKISDISNPLIMY